jgi:hypothetical protein
MRALPVVFTAALALGFLGTGTLFAQQPSPPTNQVVGKAVYRPLTLWRKVAIGGAYYADPSYVSNLRYAYGYNFQDASESVKAALAALVETGHAKVAFVNPATGDAHPVEAANLPDLESTLKTTQPVVILTETDDIGGASKPSAWLADLKMSPK